MGGICEGAIDVYARRGLWALVVWAVLLLYVTFTHQPPYQTDFAGWSRYVTGTGFLVGHLLGSILGAGIGILGFVALSIVLADRGVPRLALWGLVTAVLGATLTTAVFGVAAFAQPAIGRSYLAGHADMVELYNDVNGVPLFATAATGVLLLSAGLVLYGIGVARSRLASRLAGLPSRSAVRCSRSSASSLPTSCRASVRPSWWPAPWRSLGPAVGEALRKLILAPKGPAVDAIGLHG